MAYYIINVGAAPNDGTGDKARVAFQGINSNFALVQSTTDALNTALATKIGGTNPALGAATATTAATADNSTLVATTAYVKANLASYLTASAAGTTYAALGGATFTASPLVPTPLSTDNTTKAANTSWVRTFVSGTTLTLPAGTIIGTGSALYATNANLNTQIPWDDTIPQITEGVQIISVSVTAQAALNTFRMRFSGEVATSAASWVTAAVFADGAASAIAASGVLCDEATGSGRSLVFDFFYTPGDTAAHTLTVRVGPDAAVTVRMNGAATARRLGGIMAAALSWDEIKA
jgi:hypothetical protein